MKKRIALVLALLLALTLTGCKSNDFHIYNISATVQFSKKA